MSPEDLFSLAGSAAVVGWAILVLAPRRFRWLNAVPMWVIPAALSAVYAVLVLRHFAGAEGGYDTLESVSRLFESDWALLAGWVHYLAFDLFVGAIMAARLDRVGVNRLVQAPILLTIFMLGPFGFVIAALTEAGLRTCSTHAVQPEVPNALA